MTSFDGSDVIQCITGGGEGIEQLAVSRCWPIALYILQLSLGSGDESFTRRALAAGGMAVPPSLPDRLTRAANQPPLLTQLLFVAVNSLTDVLLKSAKLGSDAEGPSEAETCAAVVAVTTAWTRASAAGGSLASVSMADLAAAGCQGPLLSKLAQLFAAAAYRWYPGEWPGAMDLLMALVTPSPTSVSRHSLELFLRMVQQLDAVVVARDNPNRSSDALVAAARVKDALRDTGMAARLVGTLHGVATQVPDAAPLALDDLAPFLEWVDISLACEAAPMLLSALRAPQVQVASAACWYEIASKGMPAPDKLALMEQVGLLNVLGEELVAPPGSSSRRTYERLPVEVRPFVTPCRAARSDEDAEFIRAVCRILHTLAAELPTNSQLAADLLSLALGLALAGGHRTSLATASVSFARMRKGGAVSDAAASALLLVAARRIEYPEDYAFDPSDRDDAEEDFDADRHEAVQLWRAVARAHPTVAAKLVMSLLEEVSSPRSNTNGAADGSGKAKDDVVRLGSITSPRGGVFNWAEFELALHLLMVLGDAVDSASSHALAQSNYWQTAVGAAVRVNTPRDVPSCVDAARFDLVYKFHRYLATDMQALASVVETLAEAALRFRPRAAYTLLRISKPNKDALRSMAPFLMAVCGTAVTNTDLAGLGSPDLAHLLEAGSVVCGTHQFPEAELVECFLNVVNAVGARMDPLLLPAAQQHDELALAGLAAAVQCLAALTKGIHASGATNEPGSPTSMSPSLSMSLSRSANDVTSVATASGRSTPAPSDGRESPSAGDQFDSCLGRAMQLAATARRAGEVSQDVRAGYLTFLRCVCESVGPASFVQAAPSAVALALQTDQVFGVADVTALLRFLSQIASRGGPSAGAVLAGLWLPLLQHVFGAVAQASAADATPTSSVTSEARREVAELQKTFYTYVQALAAGGVVSVMLEPADNLNALVPVLESLGEGARFAAQPGVSKAAFLSARALAVELYGVSQDALDYIDHSSTASSHTATMSEGESVDAFVQCMYNVLLPATVYLGLSDSFDLQDAQSRTTLAEAAALLMCAYARRPSEVERYLTTSLLPSLPNCSPTDAASFVSALAATLQGVAAAHVQSGGGSAAGSQRFDVYSAAGRKFKRVLLAFTEAVRGAQE